MPKMRIVKLFCVIAAVAVILSGCSGFRLTSSIDDLISPVSPSGDNAGVQSAVDEYCKGGYSIKIPASGEYTTSFILKDIDGDGVNEAVAFYEPSDKVGTVCMAVIKKSNDKWSVLDSVDGVATDVNCVDFCDFDNDGTEEIIVCWSVVSKTAGTTVNVYKQKTNDKSSFTLKSVSKAIDGSDFICVDANDDDVKELLVFSTGTSSENPQARLYSFEDGSKKLIGETRLDSTITSFENITYAQTDEGTSVYADAICAEGTSMVTEFLYWSDYYDSIISPFYSYSTGRTKETLRNNSVICRDIDGDEAVEIPCDASTDNSSDEVTAQNWKTYGNTVLSHKCYSFSCKRDGFILVVDDDIFDSVKAKYDSESRKFTLTDKDSGDSILEIITVISSSYKENDGKYDGYTDVMSNSGFTYLAKVNDKSDIDINIQNVKDMIKVY